MQKRTFVLLPPPSGGAENRKSGESPGRIRRCQCGKPYPEACPLVRAGHWVTEKAGYGLMVLPSASVRRPAKVPPRKGTQEGEQLFCTYETTRYFLPGSFFSAAVRILDKIQGCN